MNRLSTAAKQLERGAKRVLDAGRRRLLAALDNTGKEAEVARLREDEAAARQSAKRHKADKEALARTNADLTEQNRMLERKVGLLLAAGAAGGEQPKDWQTIVGIAEGSLDDAETRAKIAAYHATFEKKSYSHVWAERVKQILDVLAVGETDLSRSLALVRRNEERKRKMGLGDRRWVINDRYMELPWRPAASAYRSAVFEAVLDQARPDTTKIIETGSGWGEHLFNVFLEGGPIDATYYALEMEEEGRKCSELLGSLEPKMRLKTRHFDYRHADYAGIPKDGEHTILLTAHSIEQVAEIDENCILGALDLGGHVTGIHFEPVGWQTYEEAAWTEISRQHFERCTEKSYNKNLWKLLKNLEGAGKIKILDLKINLIGLDYNPATYILWEKAKG